MRSLWSDKLKIGYEEYKGTDILEFQWKNPIEKSHDVDIGTKCAEHFIDSEKTWVDSFDEKDRRMGVELWNPGPNKGFVEGNKHSETVYK